MKRRSLPPGFRFHPTHVELIMFYLKRRVMQKKLPGGVISELDIYKYAPWDLPVKSCLKSGDLKWYFFCPIERKYASGARIKRATEFGYWKSTGKDRAVNYNNDVVGQIKTLTFFRGKAPKGDPTDWVMHEYRIEEKNLSLKNVAQDAYVLCVIFQKDGPGPRNGAQYGAPFKEDDWDDDGPEGIDHLEVDLSSGPSVLPSKEAQSSFAPDTSTTPSNTFCCLSASCISENLESTSKEIPQIASGSTAPVEIPQNQENIDEGFTFDDFFPKDGNWNSIDIDGIQATVAASNNADKFDTIYKDLEDLLALDGDGNAYITGPESMISSDQMPFMELNDLDAPLNCTFEVENYHQDLQMSNFHAAAFNHRSSVIEPRQQQQQPLFPFSSFGGAAANPSLHNSNDHQIMPPDWH